MKIGVFISILLCGLVQAQSATITADSVSQADVQAAVNSASDGDTVEIPAGSATWTSFVTWTTKGIHLKGAGTNQTIITENVTSGFPKTALYVHSIPGKYVRISDFQIIGGSSSFGVIHIGSPNPASRKVDWFRAYNLLLTNIQTRGIVAANAVGVIDHCMILAPGEMTAFHFEGQDDGSQTPDSWEEPFTYGTTNCTVVEDCVVGMPNNFSNGSFDAYSAAKYVMRNCIITNGSTGGHGTDSSGVLRSPIGCEFYGNTIIGTIGSSKGYLGNWRGGTFLVFSNTIYANHASDDGRIHVDAYRNTGVNIYATVCCDPWGPVTGDNVWDGNTDQYGYPALDQIGRAPPTTYGVSSTTQVLMPAYAWQNRYWYNGTENTTVANTFYIRNTAENAAPYDYIPEANFMLQEGRDFYSNTVMPDYEPLVYPHPLVSAESSESSSGASDVNVTELRIGTIEVAP